MNYCSNLSNITHTHLCLWVRCKVESLERESHGCVCAGGEMRGPWVSPAVQHTSANDSNHTKSLLTVIFLNASFSIYSPRKVNDGVFEG